MTHVAAELAAGTELAGYRIERVLGRGGMGVLYVAQDLTLGRSVALKVIAPELAGDVAFRERFIRESQIAASIDHPNVLPVYRAGEEDGTLFLAIRLVGGTDLRTIIDRDGALGVDRATSIVTQVAAALDAAHARDLVHRDVKPANILVAESSADTPNHVYLSDFGLTKRAAARTGITHTGQFLGTADYAAPEQFEGKPLDGRTDLYSLGCVLFECLTGEPPYPRDREWRPCMPICGSPFPGRPNAGPTSRTPSIRWSPGPWPRIRRTASPPGQSCLRRSAAPWGPFLAGSRSPLGEAADAALPSVPGSSLPLSRWWWGFSPRLGGETRVGELPSTERGRSRSRSIGSFDSTRERCAASR